MPSPTTHIPVEIHEARCIRCQVCDMVCPGDVLYKEPHTQELPVVKYPDECWYCGLCEQMCPTDAITIVFHENMMHPTVSLEELVQGKP